MKDPEGIHAMPLGQFDPCDGGDTGGVAVGPGSDTAGGGADAVRSGLSS
ncbi:MAG TPA: hypothetical protein PKL73_25140 [Polyangiaceae bacterium]|jgi:hypothetical protein|nr:MAG: hypothetical protein BWY17_04656 [Deltaproteobacteria bacterium ADurb.Bin207]HNT00272.1 hypothetical protein [Polyangiaceae bacterium]HNZ24339.1 hypothetical protein [Polyangiaceae bacterium]HOD25124.1 hypothetical protein [Polyangiaceae bacterium]HOE51982.1 hypothetical protein [Polyangiaceae bacterium]